MHKLQTCTWCSCPQCSMQAKSPSAMKCAHLWQGPVTRTRASGVTRLGMQGFDQPLFGWQSTCQLKMLVGMEGAVSWQQIECRLSCLHDRQLSNIERHVVGQTSADRIFASNSQPCCCLRANCKSICSVLIEMPEMHQLCLKGDGFSKYTVFMCLCPLLLVSLQLSPEVQRPKPDVSPDPSHNYSPVLSDSMAAVAPHAVFIQESATELHSTTNKLLLLTVRPDFA